MSSTELCPQFRPRHQTARVRTPFARMLPSVIGAGSDGIERDFRDGLSRGYCPGMGTLMLMVRLFHK
jgi:hypothetical protein